MIVNRSNILEHLLEKHLNLVEKTTLDALFEKNWRSKWTISRQQHEEFKRYCIPLIKRIFKCNKTKAVNTFEWFMTNYGLTIK